jgi:hypothetical protein
MLISLPEAASFLLTRHAVIEELWRRREESLAEAEIITLIEATEPDVGSGYLFQQLKKLRFLVESDLQQSVWTLAPVFARWLNHLQHIPQPISSAVIHGRLVELQYLSDSFQAAVFKDDLEAGREMLTETRRCYQCITEDLLQTRMAIAHEVSEAKGEHRRQSPRDRFRRINRFWTEYLLPMIELLNPTGALEAICTAWEKQLAHAVDKGFLPDVRLAERVEREMQVLRVALRQSFRECRNELEPLHSRLRRESQLAEGAAQILSDLERSGVQSFTLPLSTFRYMNQISSPALIASAARIFDFSQPPTPIDFGSTAVPGDIQALENLLAEIECLGSDRFPIDDFLGWLVDHYSDRGFHVVLHAFSFVVTDSRFLVSFTHPIREYAFCDGKVRCGHVKLSIRSAA